MFKFVFVLCVVFGALIWGVIVNVLYVFSWIFFGNFFGATYTGLIEYALIASEFLVPLSVSTFSASLQVNASKKNTLFYFSLSVIILVIVYLLFGDRQFIKI